jgi:heat shock protein HtpX
MAAVPRLYSTDFASAIARNKRNTLVLIAVLTLISGGLGYVIGWAIGIVDDIWSLPPEAVARLTASAIVADLFAPPRPQALIGAAAMIAFGLVWGGVTLVAGARLLAASIGARPADAANPAERRFIDVVEEMAIAAGLPLPRAMVVETPALNAFASGGSPERAMITATSGLLGVMTREELQGVIGHEMSHIADYDVRYATVVAAMAGAAVLVQHVLLDMVRWSAWSGGPRRDREDGGARGGLTIVVMLIAALAAIIAPIAAKLVQLAISRQREYLADASSVKLTRDPLGLIRALQRLQQSDTALARPDSPVSALCIAPVRMSFSNPFATHPPLEDRIARLENLGGLAGAPPPDAPPPAASSRHGPWG